MNFWAVFKVAARALARNKMRSALTTLGIIIGVSAVIALVSIGQGAQFMVQNQINSFGSNLLFVMPNNTIQGGANIATGGGNSLTVEDVHGHGARTAGYCRRFTDGERDQPGSLRQPELAFANPGNQRKVHPY